MPRVYLIRHGELLRVELELTRQARPSGPSTVCPSFGFGSMTEPPYNANDQAATYASYLDQLD